MTTNDSVYVELRKLEAQGYWKGFRWGLIWGGAVATAVYSLVTVLQ